MILVNAHGNAGVEVGGEVLFKDELYIDGNIPMKQVFRWVNSIAPDAKIDFFIISCNGAAAIDDVDFLPVGSAVVTLSSENRYTFFSDVNRLYDSLDVIQDGLTAENLLKLYLTKCFEPEVKYHIPIPRFGISGGPKVALFDLVVQDLDTGFDDKKQLERELGSFLSKKEIRTIARKFSDVEEGFNIYLDQRGKVLAVSFAKFEGEIAKEKIADKLDAIRENGQFNNSSLLAIVDYTMPPKRKEDEPAPATKITRLI